MMREDRQFDEPLEESLDQLGKLLAPEPAAESDFVLRVMQQIDAAPARVRQRGPFRRRLLYMVVGAAACLVVAIAIWRTTADRHEPPETAVNRNESGKTEDPQSAASPRVEPANIGTISEPVVRTSTWSVVTENMVLEGDVPVRELLYREFERVEVLDAQGNAESRLVVPTKVMLLASEEWY